MKKYLFGFLLSSLVLVAYAVYQRAPVLRFDWVSALSTNLAYTNINVLVPATTAVFVVEAQATNAHTAGLGFTTEQSYDATNWVALTNFVLSTSGTNKVNTNIVVSLGNYNFVRLSGITNTAANPIRVRFDVISK